MTRNVVLHSIDSAIEVISDEISDDIWIPLCHCPIQNQLSKRLKQLQRQRNPNQDTPSSMMSLTSRQELSALEAAGMTVVEMNHQYGMTPSDLQGYFAMIQQKHCDSSNTNHYRSNGELLSPTTATHITTTCKSSTDTETFYYDTSNKKAEHHILMPALDEKDSAEPSTLMDDTPKHVMEDKMNIIAKVKSPSNLDDIDDIVNDGDDEDDDEEEEGSENMHRHGPNWTEDELDIEYGSKVTAESKALEESLKPPSIQVTPHLVSEPTTVDGRYSVRKGRGKESGGHESLSNMVKSIKNVTQSVTKRAQIVISDENQQYDDNKVCGAPICCDIS